MFMEGWKYAREAFMRSEGARPSGLTLTHTGPGSVCWFKLTIAISHVESDEEAGEGRESTFHM